MNHLTDMKIAWDNLVCVHEYLDPEAPGQIAPPASPLSDLDPSALKNVC